LRFKLAGFMAGVVPSSSYPLAVAARAYSRVHSELVRIALLEPTDLYYGGTTGALAAVAEAGRRAGVPYALDMEDFHSAEQDDTPQARVAHRLAERIEGAVVPRAAFVTAGSAAIAETYAKRHGVHVIPINNTFPLPTNPPNLLPSPGEGLRLYWFSQTIGPGRGLEDAIRAMGFADVPGEMHLRGEAISEYMDGLRQLSKETAPRLRIFNFEPASPDAMVDLAREYDLGLSTEQGHVPSRALCLTNKVFTYILAGLGVVLTDTPGQRALASSLGEGAISYRPGDFHTLAAGLRRWSKDKRLLARAKAAGWEAARRRWHWEHPDERGALLRAVGGALQ
jgi:hypothetical protein